MIARAVLFLACVLMALPVYAQGSGGAILTPNGTGTGSFPSLDNGPPQEGSAPGSSASNKGDTGSVTKYVKPTWGNLIGVMIHYNAFDVDDNSLLDEYARAVECDLYKQFHDNDFMWRKVQEDMRISLRQAKDSSPVFFHYDAKLQLDHYDFDKNLYVFTEKTKIKNVNAFMLLRGNPAPCDSQNTLQYLPIVFHAVIDDPLKMLGLPISSKEGSKLYDLMAEDQNIEHFVYARFNLHIVSVAPLEKRHSGGVRGDIVYEQLGMPGDNVRLDTILDSVDFYEDKAMTKLIYTYTPTVSTVVPDKSDIP